MEEKTITIERIALSNGTSRIELILAQFYIWYKQLDAQTRQMNQSNDNTLDYQHNIMFISFFETISTALDAIFNRTQATGIDKLDKFGTIFQIKSCMRDIIELFKLFGYDVSEYTVVVPTVDEHNYHDVQDMKMLDEFLKPYIKELIYY